MAGRDNLWQSRRWPSNMSCMREACCILYICETRERARLAHGWRWRNFPKVMNDPRGLCWTSQLKREAGSGMHYTRGGNYFLGTPCCDTPLKHTCNEAGTPTCLELCMVAWLALSCCCLFVLLLFRLCCYSENRAYTLEKGNAQGWGFPPGPLLSQWELW